MNKRKILKGLVYLVIIVIIAITVNLIISKKTQQEVLDALDSADKNISIQQLYELRGRVVEIKELSDSIPQNKLKDAVESISSTKLYNETYLDDFSLEVSESSELGEICEDYISQIDAKIDSIKYK